MDPIDPLAAVERAHVGVFAYVTAAGRPNACAVTPYVVAGLPVVTSTLAFVAKAAAVRRDPRVTLLAGGTELRGTGVVTVDLTPEWFDRHLRAQELEKYPPARKVVTVPCHRRLFSWYVGRVVVSLTADEVYLRPGSDATTITVLDADGRLRTAPTRRPGDLAAPTVEVDASVPDGHAVVLVHEEDADMRDLRQLALHGRVESGSFVVERRTGSLEPTSGGWWHDLTEARRLAGRARRNAATLRGWPAVTR